MPCTGCGADVNMAIVITPNGPERVPLEVAAEAAGLSSHADRYRIVKDNPTTAEKVPAGAPGSFYPDHRWECPAHNAGRL
jgi:hypothetical protein